jgi:protein-tyrosine-phosphatase/predicted ATP-grasp superfamily ATP-dependent carboligase
MRILVTDAHELAGLGAIRSLGRAGHRVIAGYPSKLQRPASAYSRYCDTRRTYPDPWLSQPDFCRWLIANAPDVDLIMPISEAALLAAVSCRSQLPSEALVAPSTAALQYTLSKRRATAKALALGIPCPRTAFSLEDVPAVKAPWVVRTDNRLADDGSYRKGRNWYVDDASELMDLLGGLTEDGEQWMVQEHIVGKGGGAFLLMWRSQAVLEFAHERVHEVPFYGGVSSLRRSVRDSATVATAMQLLASIGYEGAAMFEFRRSHLNQVPYFIEINGRLWGSLALALHAGADFPAKLVECHAGTVAPRAPGDYATGIYCRNVYPGETDYLRSVLAVSGPVRGVYPPGKGQAVREFFRLFFTPRMHYDYFWLSDPLPWVRESIRTCIHIVQSRWSKWMGNARQRRLLQELERKRLTETPELRRVLFVCYGNICRSAFAGAYWNQNGGLPAARSVGFHVPAKRRTPPRISRLAKEFGVDLTGHRSSVIDSEAVERATAIFVMDGQNTEDLLKVFPQARPKTWLLGSFCGVPAINDPYLLPETEARASLRQVKQSVDVIMGSYTNSSNAAPSRVVVHE